MVKILRKFFNTQEAQFPKVSVFIGQNSIFCNYCIQTGANGVQIQVYNINNEFLTHFSHFISAKVKINLRKSQAQFREMLRILRLRQGAFTEFRI